VLVLPQAGKIGRDVRCARLTAEVDEELSEAETRLERGDPRAARRLVDRIDKRFSRLAAPRSVALAQKPGT
jgi:hypothetical protein